MRKFVFILLLLFPLLCNGQAGRDFNFLDESRLTGYETYVIREQPLFPKAEAVAQFKDDSGKIYADTVRLAAAGEVFDCLSSIYDSSLSHYNWYNIYSVSIAYAYHYVKEPGAAPDTLLVQFYGPDSIITHKIPAPGHSFSEPAAYVKYQQRSNTGSGSFQTIKYVLTPADSTESIRFLKLPVLQNKGLFVPGGKLFAYTVSYRPGFTYTPGDTIDERLVPAAKHLHSRFSIFIGHNIVKDEQTDYENGLFAWDSPLQNPWQGFFMPGAADTAHHDVLYSIFHILPGTGHVSGAVNEPYIYENQVYLYPNPSNGKVHVLLPGNTGEPHNVIVSDIGGRSYILQAVNGPEGYLTFDMTSLPPGTYTCSMVLKDRLVISRLIKI